MDFLDPQGTHELNWAHKEKSVTRRYTRANFPGVIGSKEFSSCFLTEMHGSEGPGRSDAENHLTE